MALVTCPGCGREVELDRFRRDAQEFCANCDFPLFFSDNVLVADSERDLWETPVAAIVQVRRRLPGAVGRDDLVGEACPVCAEPNLPDAVYCHRCGSSMRPAPQPEPEPEPVAPPPPEVSEPAPTPAPVERFPTLAVVLTAIFMIVVLGVAGAVVVHYWP